MSAISTSGFQLSTDSKPSRAELTATTCAPQRSSIALKSERASISSSTTRTRKPSSDDGQSDSELRALILSGALGRRGAAVQLHEVPHDCEAETQATVVSRSRTV